MISFLNKYLLRKHLKLTLKCVNPALINFFERSFVSFEALEVNLISTIFFCFAYSIALIKFL